MYGVCMCLVGGECRGRCRTYGGRHGKRLFGRFCQRVGLFPGLEVWGQKGPWYMHRGRYRVRGGVDGVLLGVRLGYCGVVYLCRGGVGAVSFSVHVYAVYDL